LNLLKQRERQRQRVGIEFQISTQAAGFAYRNHAIGTERPGDFLRIGRYQRAEFDEFADFALGQA